RAFLTPERRRRPSRSNARRVGDAHRRGRLACRSRGPPSASDLLGDGARPGSQARRSARPHDPAGHYPSGAPVVIVSRTRGGFGMGKRPGKTKAAISRRRFLSQTGLALAGTAAAMATDVGTHLGRAEGAPATGP